MKRGKNSISGEYFQFFQYIQKFDADAALKLLKRMNEATKKGNLHVQTGF